MGEGKSGYVIDSLEDRQLKDCPEDTRHVIDSMKDTGESKNSADDTENVIDSVDNAEHSAEGTRHVIDSVFNICLQVSDVQRQTYFHYFLQYEIKFLYS